MLTSLFLLLSFAASPLAPPADLAGPVVEVAEHDAAEAEGRIKFRIRNRTLEDIDIYTGHNRKRVGACATTRWIRLQAGAEVRLWDGTSRGEVLFEVTEDMDDQTLDLADYHNTMGRACSR